MYVVYLRRKPWESRIRVRIGFFFCPHIATHIICMFVSPESDWSSLSVRRGLHLSAQQPPIWAVTLSHLLLPLCVYSCDLGALIDCRGNVRDWGSQACVWKPPSAHMCQCSVCEGFALIFLIRHSFTWDMGLFWLPRPFIYLYLMKRPRACPSHNGM